MKISYDSFVILVEFRLHSCRVNGKVRLIKIGKFFFRSRRRQFFFRTEHKKEKI
jgi:hypothetical protein